MITNIIKKKKKKKNKIKKKEETKPFVLTIQSNSLCCLNVSKTHNASSLSFFFFFTLIFPVSNSALTLSSYLHLCPPHISAVDCFSHFPLSGRSGLLDREFSELWSPELETSFDSAERSVVDRSERSISVCTFIFFWLKF